MNKENIPALWNSTNKLKASIFHKTDDHSLAIAFTEADLHFLLSSIDLTAPRKFSSHRKYIGVLIASAKTIFSYLMSPVLRVLLHKQVEVNHTVLLLVEENISLRNDVEALKRKLEGRYREGTTHG
jgi:hypothetical protein